MTLGVDKLTNEELLKVIMCMADMTKKSIAEISNALEKQDMERLLRTIIKHKELWNK